MSEKREWEARQISEILLNDPNFQNPAYVSLRREDFTDPRNALIFWAARKLTQRGERVSLEGIAQELRARDLLEFVGGESYLMEFAEMIVAAGPGVPTLRGEEVQP